MAKTAKFDRQQVIDLATNLYWQKGFHATSMRNLQDEIDMRPGSIYAAFGNKDGLFKETLKNYTDAGIAQITKCLDMHDSPLEALKAFVRFQVIDSKEAAPSGLCMLTKTIGELTSDNQELIELTKSHLSQITGTFAKVIAQAQECGELSNVKSCDELANYLQVQITGLRTFSKVNLNNEQLALMIEEVFTHYPFNV
ncbi:TetR/AcrR family transcriptional regulator [Thalassotalea marina]|uniref:TetR family transcriptional regulator n=1 Tax=Thalassotalea marina TaxID=1673741 RepID=A0A919ELP3_9GAMM|nr:TetR/AcrR family transcriptional regulator [Thalassotalea marina]GHF95781.1 TetR family transcriptional regulator [Thalassotalea marina]